MPPIQYFKELAQKNEDQIHLAEAALQIAVEEYPQINIASYLELLKSWSVLLRQQFSGAPIPDRMNAINDLLFRKMRFTGNVENYYDPKNSFLNDVIDRRKGIPITLSVLYLELAWSLGLEASGISFPGHFLVRIMSEREPLYVDTFHKGNIMTVEGCKEFWNDLNEAETEFQESFLSAISKKQILSRMLRNLKGIYLDKKDYKKLIRVLDNLILLSPEVPEEIRDRGIIHYQTEAFKLALIDFETFLSVAPDSEDTEVIHQYVEVLREYSSHLN